MSNSKTTCVHNAARVATLAAFSIMFLFFTFFPLRVLRALPINSTQRTPNILVKPGRSVGELALGDTKNQAVSIFPKKPNKDEEYTYFTCGPRTELHWLDDSHPESWGVFIYIKDGRVYQIESATPRFQTHDGITYNSTADAVRSHYKKLRAFQLKNSAAKVSGGRDLIYWVDQNNGIAFELYYNPIEDERRVNSIAIFQPTVEFHPEGCIVSPQEWIELAPYTLEPPDRDA